MPTLLEQATLSDASEILELQKLCYQSEAKAYNDFTIPPLVQNLAGIEDEFKTKVFLKAVDGNKIIGSVRAFLDQGVCYIERLIVHPNHQGQGLGTVLMNGIELHFGDAERIELFTGSKSEANRLYERLGFVRFKRSVLSQNVTLVFLEKVK